MTYGPSAKATKIRAPLKKAIPAESWWSILPVKRRALSPAMVVGVEIPGGEVDGVHRLDVAKTGPPGDDLDQTV
jgi:hypothetical protein